MSEKIKLTITPRFCELDGLGHINNAVPLEWCETARIPLFKIFTPGLELDQWRLIIVRNEVDYIKQIDYGTDVLVETYLSKLGNSSMNVEHELFQGGDKVAHVKCIMIHFDYKTNKSVTIPDEERKKLGRYHATN